MPSVDLTQFVKQAAVEAGFDLAGIAPIADFPELEYFRRWIANGYGGDMRYLESRGQDGDLKRAAAGRLFPWARSVVIGAVNYNALPPPPFHNTSSRSRFRAPVIGNPNFGDSQQEAETSQEGTENKKEETGSGWISRYACSKRDYHEMVMERLRCLERRLHEAAGEPLETRCYVDTGPLIERVYARYAGIGWVGKNTCIINQHLGSWLFLGVILTSLELRPAPAFHSIPLHPPSEGGKNAYLRPSLAAPDRCGTCRRCLDACPTKAFLGPRELDASRCISYLTIEKRGEIATELCEGMGRHVFGCDLCQDVCPWNRKAPLTLLPDFQPRPGLVNPRLERLASMSDKDFREEFRGSPIKRAKRTGLRRNAVIAMGNSGDPRFLPLLRELAHDPDESVAKHALKAAAQLDAKMPSRQGQEG